MSTTADRVAWHFADARTDAMLVRASVWVEQLAALAYAASAERLTGAPRHLAERFAEHERDHAAAMETVLEGLTVGVRNRPVQRDVHHHLPALRDGGRAAILEALAELEAALVAAYLEMGGSTREPELLRTVGAVMAGAAQHLVALRRELGKPLVERGA
jgi:rubrerythrin